jgi:DNA (cytosine-5)-methyltransferase 1
MAIKVFDFFSGCGGTSAGLRAAGLEIACGIDNDPDAALTFKSNFPKAKFIQADLTMARANGIKNDIEKCREDFILFCGCAPCQPFSQQRRKHPGRRKKDERVPLLLHFGRFIRYYLPDFVLVENVPGIQHFSKQQGPFAIFTRMLGKLDYHLETAVVDCREYGVPQRRSRLILMASRHFTPKLPSKSHGAGTASPNYSTVRDWILDLPPIRAGETCDEVPNHRAAKLSPLNLQRIQATPPGGTRRAWPSKLQLACHENGHTGHTDVYGRLRWDQPSSALTTRCISLSNGRFGHPTQDRAISVREAACLQTFPRDFTFHGSLNSMARQVGNAVPVLLAQRLGEALMASTSI